MKLPLLLFLAALTGLAPVAVAAPGTATPVPTVPAAQAIYAGAMQNNWQYWGWATVSPAAATAPTPSLMTGALQVSEGAWQAVYLHHDPMQTRPSQTFSFYVYGGRTGGQKLSVEALRSGAPQTTIALAPLRANVWQRVSVSLARLGAGSAADFDGFWIRNNSAGALAPFYLNNITLSGSGAAPPPVVLPPAAPSGLSATPAWSPSCPVCGGMPMVHILLAWDTVPGASAYTVYRDGVKQTAQSGLTWTDMNVISASSYSYTVTATGPGGESVPSAAVSATAPSPPAGALTAPVNLALAGVWAGAPTDTLTWSPVPGAASYNVYQYGLLVGAAVPAAPYTVPVSTWWNGMTYTVTAVDSMGMESLPSAPAGALGGLDPSQTPGWNPDAPTVPTHLTATPEWNSGKPRVHLAWQGSGWDYAYTLYRDGAPLHAGLWGLNGYDTDIQPGETHSYSVAGTNVVWTRTVVSAASSAVTATALTGPPAALSAAVQITDITPNDDGATIAFAAVPGAVDYRVYDVAKPNTVKYSGGGLSIEMNGLNPSSATLVVEAVDKLGPFQTMDGMAGPGAMQMDGVHSAINGQGDPSNVPAVLAVSAPTAVSCTRRTLTGAQAFFDNFRGENPLTTLPCPAPVPGESGSEYGYPDNYLASANDKWEIRDYNGDLDNSRVFFMGSHFMDTLYDGGTAHVTPVMHNNNASLVMMPKATADISGGKVLHVTFEVDAHMDGRRWCDLFVGPAGETLTDPSKFADFAGRRPDASGRLFRWEIHENAHSLSVFPGTQPDAQSDVVYLTHQDNGVGPDSFGICARSGPWCEVPWNGTDADLDKRHKFDLYLSKTRAVIMEQGRVVKDAAFPAGVELPFDQCQVYFVHQVYHTGNDRPELLVGDPADSYWYNYRPFSDERHWDNMGFSVLDGFPAQP